MSCCGSRGSSRWCGAPPASAPFYGSLRTRYAAFACPRTRPVAATIVSVFAHFSKSDTRTAPDGAARCSQNKTARSRWRKLPLWFRCSARRCRTVPHGAARIKPHVCIGGNFHSGSGAVPDGAVGCGIKRAHAIGREDVRGNHFLAAHQRRPGKEKKSPEGNSIAESAEPAEYIQPSVARARTRTRTMVLCCIERRGEGARDVRVGAGRENAARRADLCGVTRPSDKMRVGRNGATQQGRTRMATDNASRCILFAPAGPLLKTRTGA